MTFEFFSEVNRWNWYKDAVKLNTDSVITPGAALLGVNFRVVVIIK